MSIFSNLKVLNNLEVSGVAAIDSDKLNIKDRYSYHNNGYDNDQFAPSGLVFNRNTVSKSNVFDGTIISLTNTTITIVDTDLLQVGDYIQIRNAQAKVNNGLYLVGSIVGNVITIDITSGGVHSILIPIERISLGTIGIVDAVSITYLETTASGSISVNSGSNTNSMNTIVVGDTNLPSLLLGGDIGGQDAAGGQDVGELRLRGNLVKDLPSIIDGTVVNTTSDTIEVQDSGNILVGHEISVTVDGGRGGFFTYNYNVIGVSGNVITVDDVDNAVASGSIDVNIVGNNNTVVLDGVGNPIPEDDIYNSAVVIEDSGTGKGGLFVEGNVLLGDDSTLYTNKISSTDDTVSFVDSYVEQNLASIRTVEVINTAGYVSFGRLATVYIVDVVGTVTLSLPFTPVFGVSLTIINIRGGVVNIDAGIRTFDDTGINNISLVNKGEKITILYYDTVWYIL